MNIGFTGTQESLTSVQREALFRVLHEYARHEERVFHHGNCIGADASSHYIAGIFGFRRALHRPVSGKKEARCPISVELGDAVRPRKDYLERNHDIVDETDLLIAGPKEETGEALRSGTWSTVRYARSLRRKILIIRPSGKVEIENDRTSLES